MINPAASRLATLTFLLLWAAPGTAPAQGRSGPIAVRYLANEGVLVTAGNTGVLIDALMADGLPDYPVVASPTRDSLEGALGRFAQVNLVLITHVHRDHFNAQAVAAHLRANPEAVVVGSSQVADSLRLLAGWTDRGRVRVAPATPGSMTTIRHGDITVTAHGIPHPPSRNQPVEHLVWVIEHGGRRVMHLGDSSPTPAELAAAAGNGVELLLAPFWVLGGLEGLERIAATRASRVAAFHFARNARPFVGSREITPWQAAGAFIELP